MAKRILIVDDTSFMRKMLADGLVQNGYAIAGEASNGREAIRLYAELQPDLVVMDINMPEMGGIEAVRELIKADPEAVILVCTAASQQAQIHEAMREGAKGYILKPFKMTRVLELIGKYADVRTAREQEREPEQEQVEELAQEQDQEQVRAEEQAEELAQEQQQAQAGSASDESVTLVEAAGMLVAAAGETPERGGAGADVEGEPKSLAGIGSAEVRVDLMEGSEQSRVLDDQEDRTRTAGEQDHTPAASREAGEEDTARQLRSGKVAPLRRRDRMHSFVSSVMCHWQEERDGEPATYTVVCTESENKVVVELSDSGQTKQMMQFSLEGLLQLSNWLEDHLDRTRAGRGLG